MRKRDDIYLTKPEFFISILMTLALVYLWVLALSIDTVFFIATTAFLSGIYLTAAFNVFVMKV